MANHFNDCKFIQDFSRGVRKDSKTSHTLVDELFLKLRYPSGIGVYSV
jgi:hypothetical protein